MVADTANGLYTARVDPSKLNFLAIGAAALSTFLIGGLWYSPALFGKVWQAETGEVKPGHPAKVFGLSFVLALLMAFNLAAFIGPDATLSFAVAAAFAAGLGWVALAMGVTYLFESRSLKLWLVNAGYPVVSFTVMGVILGAWK
ncbi:MAG: DUF1761 domain-containing protein [Acidobacteria bacterium]|nr:DUF1761 domain-containing protein [Acidobacteriota bacterium]